MKKAVKPLPRILRYAGACDDYINLAERAKSPLDFLRVAMKKDSMSVLSFLTGEHQFGRPFLKELLGERDYKRFCAAQSNLIWLETGSEYDWSDGLGKIVLWAADKNAARVNQYVEDWYNKRRVKIESFLGLW